MSKIEVSAGLVSPEASLYVLQMAVFSPCLPGSSHIFLCPHIYFCVLISSSFKDNSHVGLGPTPMISCYLNHPFKDPVSKYSHILRY